MICRFGHLITIQYKIVVIFFCFVKGSAGTGPPETRSFPIFYKKFTGFPQGSSNPLGEKIC